MMSLSDRIQATLRLPAYQEDFQQLFRFLQEEKFGYPDEPVIKEYIWHLLKTQPNIPEIARVANKWELPTAIDPEFRGSAKRLAPWLREAKSPSRKTIKPIQVKECSPSRYLYLKIDLHERIDVLCPLFHDYVNAHQRQLPKNQDTEGRGQPLKLDHWEIYDLIEVHGKRKRDIIRAKLEEAGITSQQTDPAMDPENRRLYKQITSAHQKAKRCIASVQPRTT
jgi:hypothetical protein